MSNKKYYFIYYGWIRPQVPNVVQMPQPGMKKIPNAGEGWGVTDIHPFEWVKRMREERGILITPKNFKEVSKEEFKLFEKTMPKQDIATAEVVEEKDKSDKH